MERTVVIIRKSPLACLAKFQTDFKSYVLESACFLVDSQFDVGTAVPENLPIGIDTVVRQA